jgi:hypothetical protein
MHRPSRCDVGQPARSLFPILLGALLAAPAAAHAGGLASLKAIPNAIDLLAGRLTIRMPAAARLEARRASIMAAPNAAQDESRVVLDAGGERMVVMAYELFALAGPKFEAALKKEGLGPKGPPLTVEKVALKGLSAYGLVPSTIKVQGDAALVLAAYVVSADSTVQLLSFYINPLAAKDAKGGQGLARRVLATLAPGTRKLQSTAGTRRLAGRAGVLEAKVPDGYLATLQAGPDFEVHHLRKLVPFGEVGPAVGVYLGGHPNFQHKQMGGKTKVTERKGKLLGRAVTWHEWAVEEAGTPKRFMVEAIVEATGNLRAHVFYGAGKAAELTQLAAIAESLKLVKK